MSPRITVALALVAAALPTAALAHPHVWVDAKADVVFDAEGRITAIRNVWRFDDAYSAFASQGLDKDGDGRLTPEELKPLAETNVESLKDFAYFTFLTANGKDIDFKAPTEFWLQSDGGLLTLYFTLPTVAPVDLGGRPAKLEVYDPTYYVDFAFVDDQPITFDGAPKSCAFSIIKPKELDAGTAAALADVPADQRDLPPDLQVVTQDLANGADLKCP